jgi:hypothetical protein
MHSGSGSGSGTGFGPGSNVKCNTKVFKNLKLKDNFMGNNAAARIEKTVVPELEPEPRN